MPLSTTSTTTKKIVNLSVDVENLQIRYTIRERITDASSVIVTNNYKDVMVTGTAAQTLMMTMGDATKTLYDNIADVSYAYLQTNNLI